MATRLRTVEYAFPTVTTTLAAATRRDFTAITVYIAENTSRVFKSVHIEYNVRGDETTAASATSYLLGIKIDAVAFSDSTITVTSANSGDPQSHIITRDVTSYFTTNFTSTSHSVQVGFQMAVLATANHDAKLIITYEFDDAAQDVRTKTVRLPLESSLAQLTASLASIGSNQIPALDTLLPEATKTYKQIWLEFVFNDAGNATTDFSLAVDLTGGTTISEVDIYRSEQQLNGGAFGRAIWDITSGLDKSATANLRARSNNLASRFSLLGAILHVTYTYSHTSTLSGTGRVMNSLVLPFADETGYPGNTTSADKARFDRVVWIEEPGTITMAQSGARVFLSDPGTVTLNIAAGSQSFRAYVMTAGSVHGGPYAFTHRIDSGSGGGAALTLARGRNVINLDRYSTSATLTGTNFSAMLFLNYTSDIHGDGDGAHNTSTCWLIADRINSFAVQRNISAPAALFDFPETDWYLTGLAFELLGNATSSAATAGTLQAERQSDEGPGAGWVDLITFIQRSDAEFGAVWTAGAARDAFVRWPADPDGERMDLLATRQYRICTASTMALAVRAWTTHHSITFAIAGTVAGSAGGTVDITAHRSASGEKIGSTSRSGNGAYSLTWYDDTEDVYTVARESGSLLARSDDGTAA